MGRSVLWPQQRLAGCKAEGGSRCVNRSEAAPLSLQSSPRSQGEGPGEDKARVEDPRTARAELR